ncbi:conserved repeat domain-containing protein [Micrococcales bacterium KH10]|nr:conserved repeat domain-containing protein [Micrococcales bacterium KH10]
MRLPLNENSRAEGGARRFVAVIVAAAVLGAMAVVGMNTNIGITPSWAAGTPLLNENFDQSSADDPAIIPLGDACLTAAPNGSSPPPGASALSNCGNRTAGGAPPRGVVPGWLQLTHAAQNSTGGILYNQALPATGGMEITFHQAQYGGNGADGISFFLTDGAYNLTATGADGGSLGYAQKVGTGATDRPGVVGGFLGLGLDAWGNFPRSNEGRGTGCAANGENPGIGNPPASDRIQNSVTLRGPGYAGTGWVNGYCLWQTQQLTGGLSLRADNLANAARTVRIRVQPTDSNGYTTITVDIDFNDGQGFRSILSHTTDVPVPETYKFGISSSTGGSHDVHLIRNVQVSSIVELEALSLVKEIDSTSPLSQATYAEGDVIPYRFTVTNGGALALNSVTVNDPLVTNVNCPSTTLARAGDAGSSMTCTGTHTVTAQEAAAASGELPNTAVATGLTPLSVLVESNESTAIALLETPAPAIELTKHAIWNDTNNDGLVNLGDTVTYTFSVENTGNITLAPVTITDPKIGLTNAMCVASLAPGASANCGPAAQGVHTINVDDLIANTVANTATATGTPPSPLSNVTDTDSTDTPTVPAHASMTVTKTASVQGDDEIGHEGELITYTFRVTNTGSVPISNIRVNDAMLNLTNWLCSAGPLGPGHYVDCVAPNMHTVDRADLRAGEIVNTVYVNADAPTGVTPPAQVQDTETVPTGDPVLGLTLVKQVDNGTTGATGIPQQWTLTATPDSIPGQSAVSGPGGINDISIRPGTYTLSEAGGPPGFSASAWSCVTAGNVPVSVNSSGVVTFTADDEVTCTITNTAIPGSVTWEKTDSEGAHLAGSVWTLTGPSHPAGVEIGDCIAADAALCIGPDRDPAPGQFALDGLAWGSYTLTETQAPIGYLLDLNPRTFVVTGAAAETGISLGAIINHQIPPLVMPLTGGWAQDYIHMAGLALLMFALVLGAYRAHRTRKSRP